MKRNLCDLCTSVAKRFDPALLLIPLIALVAVWPFATQSLPISDDGAQHLFRLVEFDRCLRHGVLCLRWAPDYAHGYGYPGFNFYMNLPTIIAEIMHLLGLDFPQANAAAIVLSFFVSGWGAYLLGRDMGGWKAGLVVATAYMYAPYQFFDAAYRGNLPELWGLAFLPWVLWTGRRVAVRRRWRDVALFAVVYAALVWSHNIMTWLGSPILGLYLLILWWQRGHTWREAWRLAAMVVLGLALSAFFWLPAYLEQVWTHYSPGLFDYGVAFLSLREMLAWPPQLDLDLLNPYPPRSQSWGMLLLIALGVVVAVHKVIAARRTKGTMASGAENRDRCLGRGTLVEWAFFALTFPVASFLPLSASAFLWRAIAPLQIVQMPWRFLSIAALAGSICAGWAITCLPDRRTLCSPALLATGGAIVVLVAMSIPWTYAAPFPQPQNAGVADIVRWEYGTGLIGQTSVNEFLPIWAPGVPEEPADPALLTEHDPIIARLDEASLPEGTTIVSADYGLMRADLVIDAPQAFRARYKQFYFPGWQVRIDGKRVPLTATAPHGLLGFDVPAGEHRIVVRPATTPLRTAGAILSALGVLATLGIVILERRGSSLAPTGRLPRGEGQLPPPATRGRLWGGILALAILALLVLAAKEGIIDRTENLFRAHRFDGTRVPGVQTEVQINFGDLLTLHGYDLPGKAVSSGDPLRIDLYLSARQPVDGSYRAYARLVDEEGRLWSLRDNGTPREFRPPPPTTIWPTGAYGHWAYLAYVLPGTPPGEYWIDVGLFEPGTWRGLNVLNEAGHIVGLSTRLGPVRIVGPRRPPGVDALDVERRLDIDVTPALRCLGSTFSTEAVQAGEILDVTLFWQAMQRPEADYAVQLTLALGNDAFPLARDLPLGRRVHPPTSWEEGEVVRSPHRLRIPAAVYAGGYAVEGTVLDAQGSPVAPPIALGEVEVLPTDRLFSIPDGIERRVDANLEHRVALLGYDLGRAEVGQIAAGESLSITLYWQAMREMDISYKVSVQLVGASGVLAQVDAVPVGWTRPTTGWVAGEVLVDGYELPVPADAQAGTYQLIVGLYDEGTLQRLAVLGPSGEVTGDHVLLQEIGVK